MDWQPIETAPRDGTKVDGWTVLAERWTNVWWEGTKNDWMHWWADNWGGVGAQRLGCQPTHWMPLPPTPSLEVDIDQGEER